MWITMKINETYVTKERIFNMDLGESLTREDINLDFAVILKELVETMKLSDEKKAIRKLCGYEYWISDGDEIIYKEEVPSVIQDPYLRSILIFGLAMQYSENERNDI